MDITISQIRRTIEAAQEKPYVHYSELPREQWQAIRAAHVQEIVSGIFLGNDRYLCDLLDGTASKGYPEGFSPKVILTVAGRGREGIPYPTLRREGITHINMPLDDQSAGFTELERQLPQIFAVFTKSVEERDPLLVHCAMGISRSVGVLILCLVHLTKLSFDKVHHFISVQRPHIADPLTYPDDYKEVHLAGQPTFMLRTKEYCDSVLAK